MAEYNLSTATPEELKEWLSKQTDEYRSTRDARLEAMSPKAREVCLMLESHLAAINDQDKEAAFLDEWIWHLEQAQAKSQSKNQ